MKILLSESHWCVREILSACCLMMGDRVEAVYFATDPSDAARSAMSLEVDAVFIEIGPFGAGSLALDGVNAIRLMRESGYVGRIISLSSPCYDHLEGAARDAGASAHLSKPFLLEEFMKILDPKPAAVRRFRSRPPIHCAP